MFYFSDDNHNVSLAGRVLDYDSITKAHSEHIDANFSIPNIFEPDAPLKIIFETVHPSLNTNNFIFSQITPDHHFYTSGQIQERRQLHRHNFYELLFVIEGNLYQNIEHQRHLYPTGSCCLLNKNVFHMEEFREDYRIVFIDFTSEFIMELLQLSKLFPNLHSVSYDKMCDFFQDDLTSENASDKSYLDFIPLESDQWIRNNVHRLFEAILKEILNPVIESELQIRSMLLQLLCLLFDTSHFEHSPMHLGSSAEQDLFHAITLYIEKNNGHVSRNELETAFNYSGDYLYKIIQKYTGLSIFDYNMKFCMREAASRLCSTNLTISQIASDLNFTNLTHFYKIFQKEYGVTPREYRKTYAKKIP